jgi:hypothetical protein
MKTARRIATISYYLSRTAALLFTLTLVYAVAVVVLAQSTSAQWLPVERTSPDLLTLFFPFTHSPFMLVETSSSYTISYFTIFAFYTSFLWLLSGVFYAFRQERLFTRAGVRRLTRFYLINGIPILILLFFIVWKQDAADILRLSILHLIIGVFAFFMAAIFSHGVILQEEQDLIF